MDEYSRKGIFIGVDFVYIYIYILYVHIYSKEERFHARTLYEQLLEEESKVKIQFILA